METKQHIFPLLPQYESLTIDELKKLLDRDSPQVRASSLAALGSHASPECLLAIAEAVKDGRNRKAPWFGFITVSWVGVVALLETGQAPAEEIARKLVNEWSAEERQDLISWLKDYPAYVQALIG